MLNWHKFHYIIKNVSYFLNNIPYYEIIVKTKYY